MSDPATSPTSPLSPPPGTTQQPPPENIFRATQPYKPRHDGEICLLVGDIVTNIKGLGNGWTLGQNVSQDILGIFPTCCIQPLSVANASLIGDGPYNSNNTQHVNTGDNIPTSHAPNNNTTRNGSSSGLVYDPYNNVHKHNLQVATDEQGNSTRSSIAKDLNNTNTTNSAAAAGLVLDNRRNFNLGNNKHNSNYEVLRSHQLPQQQPKSVVNDIYSSKENNTERNTEQQQGRNFVTFKPTPSSSSTTTQPPQNYSSRPNHRSEYSRENSMENDINTSSNGTEDNKNNYNEIKNKSSIAAATTPGGGNKNKLRSCDSHESVDGNNYYSAEQNPPVYHSGKQQGEKNKGVVGRKASPKRVRIQVDKSLNHADQVNNHDDGVNILTSANSSTEGIKPVILPNINSKQQQSVNKHHPLVSPEYNSGAFDYHQQAEGNDINGGREYHTLPTPPMKRGKINGPNSQQKPQLVVKPNHVTQKMEGNNDGRGVIHNSDILPDDTGERSGYRPPHNPRTQSSPRTRVKASPRQQSRRPHNNAVNTTPIMARVRASEPPSNLQLHNGGGYATSSINSNHPSACNVNDMENSSCDTGTTGLRSNSSGNVGITGLTRAVYVTGIPHTPPPVNTMQFSGGGYDVQDRSTSPIYNMAASPDHSDINLVRCHNYSSDILDNHVNESTLERSCRAGTPPPPGGFTMDKDYDYSDYRTLDGPDKSVRFREHGNVRYKPILKNAGGGGSGFSGNNNISNQESHVYYRGEPHKKDPVLRLIFSAIAGLLLGMLVFLWMYFYLDYSLKISIPVAVTICLTLIITFALSRLILCTAALLFPSLCTTRGRISFLILITGFLIAGPIKNVYHNMHEVSRSMGCSAEQAYNQSMLLLEPFDTMMQQLDVTVDNLQKAAYEVSVGLDPLDEGLVKVNKDIQKGKQQLYGTARVSIIMFIHCQK